MRGKGRVVAGVGVAVAAVAVGVGVGVLLAVVRGDRKKGDHARATADYTKAIPIRPDDDARRHPIDAETREHRKRLEDLFDELRAASAKEPSSQAIRVAASHEYLVLRNDALPDTWDQLGKVFLKSESRHVLDAIAEEMPKHRARMAELKRSHPDYVPGRGSPSTPGPARRKAASSAAPEDIGSMSSEQIRLAESRADRELEAEKAEHRKRLEKLCDELVRASLKEPGHQSVSLAKGISMMALTGQELSVVLANARLAFVRMAGQEAFDAIVAELNEHAARVGAIESSRPSGAVGLRLERLRNRRQRGVGR